MTANVARMPQSAANRTHPGSVLPKVALCYLITHDASISAPDGTYSFSDRRNAAPSPPQTLFPRRSHAHPLSMRGESRAIPQPAITSTSTSASRLNLGHVGHHVTLYWLTRSRPQNLDLSKPQAHAPCAPHRNSGVNLGQIGFSRFICETGIENFGQNRRT